MPNINHSANIYPRPDRLRVKARGSSHFPRRPSEKGGNSQEKVGMILSVVSLPSLHFGTTGE